MLEALKNSKSESHRIRLEASFAAHHIQMLQLPEDQRLPFLINSLRNKAQGVREWAAGELIQRSDSATFAALKSFLGTPEGAGNVQARSALNFLEGH